jgi:hypothetical protein
MGAGNRITLTSRERSLDNRGFYDFSFVQGATERRMDLSSLA